MSKKQRQYYDTPTDAFKAMQNKSVADLRREYSALRDIAQKRLKRMAGKPEAKETYAQHPGGFPKIRELEDRGDLVKALIDVSSFLTARRGSLSG